MVAPGSQLPQAAREWEASERSDCRAGSSPSFQEPKQKEREWRLCHCLVMSVNPDAFGETRSQRLTRRQRGCLWRRHLRQNIANPAAWLQHKWLTGPDRRPGQDCRSSLSQGPMKHHLHPSVVLQERAFIRPQTHSPLLHQVFR